MICRIGWLLSLQLQGAFCVMCTFLVFLAFLKLDVNFVHHRRLDQWFCQSRIDCSLTFIVLLFRDDSLSSRIFIVWVLSCQCAWQIARFDRDFLVLLMIAFCWPLLLSQKMRLHFRQFAAIHNTIIILVVLLHHHVYRGSGIDRIVCIQSLLLHRRFDSRGHAMTVAYGQLLYKSINEVHPWTWL